MGEPARKMVIVEPTCFGNVLAATRVNHTTERKQITEIESWTCEVLATFHQSDHGELRDKTCIVSLHLFFMFVSPRQGHGPSHGQKIFPSGKLTVCYFFNGHLSLIYPLEMVIFHSYVSLPEGNQGTPTVRENCWQSSGTWSASQTSLWRRSSDF